MQSISQPPISSTLSVRQPPPQHPNGIFINSAMGNAPKIGPTIAASACPSSSRATQVLINEPSNISNPARESVARNNLVNIQLQQSPILLPPSNSNITPSLPQQPLLATIPTPNASIASNTPGPMQSNSSSVNGLMQVMGSTPCLIPQPNGVPLIINVPTANYVQVPNQPSSSTNCNIPLVNSLLAANILANTNILNSGNSSIVNPPNNGVIRPTLMTNNSSSVFLTPSGIQPSISSASSSNQQPNLLSFKPAEASNSPQIQQQVETSSRVQLQTSLPTQNNLAIQIPPNSRKIDSNVPLLIASSVSSLPKDSLQRQISEDSNPPNLPIPAGNIQPVELNINDVQRVLIIKNEQQSVNPILGQLQPENLSLNCEVASSRQNTHKMRNICRDSSSTAQIGNLSPSPSTSSDPRYLNQSDVPSTSTSNRSSANASKSSRNLSKSKKLGSKLSKGKERATTQPDTLIDTSNENRKTVQNEHSSDSKDSTAIQGNFTSDNSKAPAELSLLDDRLENDRLESKIEIQEHQIKDEKPKRKLSLSNQVFGFTQYAADSPYPAASLNFASVLNNLVSPRERVNTTSADRLQASTSSDSSFTPIHPISIKQETPAPDHPIASQIDNGTGNDMEACTIKTEITTEDDSLTNEGHPQEVYAGSSSKASAAPKTSDHKNNR